MPATSIKQRRFFAIAEHHPEKLRKPAPKMSQQQMHDFAETPESELPLRKKGNSTMRRFS